MPKQRHLFYQGLGLAIATLMPTGACLMLFSGNAIANQNAPTANTTVPTINPESTEPAADTEAEATQTDTAQTETTSTAEQATAEASRFSCQVVNGQPTVMYAPQSQPGQVYPWATPTALGGGWTPEMRCNEISRRLEFYRPDGLQELRTAVENNYNTVCVTTEKNPSCRIVLTVPPGQDPMVIRDRVFENLTVADSGRQTQSVTTFTSGEADGVVRQIGQVLNMDLGGVNVGSIVSGQGWQRSRGLDLRPFLDQNDGGTGAKLQGGAWQGGRRLNPDSFR